MRVFRCVRSAPVVAALLVLGVGTVQAELLWSGQVEAYSPGPPPWTPTIVLETGESYHIVASGVVTINLSGSERDCNGCIPGTNPLQCSGIAQDGVPPNHYWAAPGTIAHGLSGRLNSEFMTVGCDTLFVAPATGLLELVFNDTGHMGAWQYSDNSGHFDVEIFRVAASDGACCFEDGSCIFVTEADCDGDWLGAETVCDPNPCPQPLGACCELWGGLCDIRTEDDCFHPGGYFGWLGHGTTCDPNPCEPVGACCLFDKDSAPSADDDGERYMCWEMTEYGCSAIGGWPWLGAGTSCNPNPCAPGACCWPDRPCEFWTGYECDYLGGKWLGPWVSCEPDPCPGPLGACCIFDWDLATVTCEILTYFACEPYPWLGEDTVCDPDPCPLPGACCEGDFCEVVPDIWCFGAWLGEGTNCDPNPCLQPLGACCVIDTGECLVLTQEDCEALPGTEYYGDSVSCDPNPCPPPVPTIDSSWGQIKNHYR